MKRSEYEDLPTSSKQYVDYRMDVEAEFASYIEEVFGDREHITGQELTDWLETHREKIED